MQRVMLHSATNQPPAKLMFNNELKPILLKDYEKNITYQIWTKYTIHNFAFTIIS